MQTVKFNEIEYQANDLLDAFELFQKKSSNVAFYGFCGCQLFVQFHNGSCYMYELTHEAVSDCINAESIGKFISNQVVSRFPSQKVESKLITVLPRETRLLKKDIFSNGHVTLGQKHEEVYLVAEDSNGFCIVENMKTGTRYPVTEDNTM